MKEIEISTKSSRKDYFFKDRFQQLLVAIFVQRRLSAMISPYIFKEKSFVSFFKLSN